VSAPTTGKFSDKAETQATQRILLDVMSINDGQPVLVFETEDNQLSFYEADDSYRDEIRLLEMAEVVRRFDQITHAGGDVWVSDPIISHSNKIYWDKEGKKYRHCGIAIRASGRIDFYNKWKLVENTK